MTFDPQGSGRSDADPKPQYCDPDGPWRRPPEMGVREYGSCAGKNDGGADAVAGQVPGVADIVVGGHTGHQGTTDIQELYDQLSPNVIFGAFDAYAWLASKANPWRGEIDFGRVAVMGHSLGAYGAAMVANGDPLRRFRAGISLDSYAHLMHGVRPRVPTLYLQSEQELLSGPRLAPPPPTALHATRADYGVFTQRRIDAMYLVLRASNHSEFAYSGPESGAPASRYGQRVATYFSLAWLDRALHRHRRAATRRLTTPRFDRSADRSSIGTGAWDPVAMVNRPYVIGGASTAASLSELYVSRYAFGGRRCADVRRGCAPSRGS